jgi:hypothetical protein
MTFSPAGTMVRFRVIGHTATLLPDGQVLVVGGGAVSRDQAELWDPATSTFSGDGWLLEPRADHTATLLPNGRVLIVGGDWGRETVELWDPVSTSFREARPLITGRYGHTTTLLSDGAVLVVGGITQTSAPQAIFSETLASAESRGSRSRTFSAAGTLVAARNGHTATLLPEGRVVVLGGEGVRRILASGELWGPDTRTFSPAVPLSEPRFGHTATLLPDGRVLVIGGIGRSGGKRAILASAERWGTTAALVAGSPAPTTWSPAPTAGVIPTPSS